MSYSDDNNVASSRDADQFISSTPVFFGIPSMLQSVAALPFNTKPCLLRVRLSAIWMV
jgi:hypothetical protein